MPGLNLTGAPNTRDYTLGRGRVRFATLTAAGIPDASGFRDLGNAPEFAINITVEDLRHQSSREQLKKTDKRFVISQEVGISFSLDEINFQNLSDFFSGSTETYDNPHDTTWLNHEDAIVASAVVLGNWYRLKDDTGVRVYDIGAAGVVATFEDDPAGVPTVLVLGTDYELDLPQGMVRFLPTAVNVAAGGTVGWIISTGATTPQDLDQVNALIRAEVVGALQFIQINAGDGGNETEYMFHKVSLSSDGDLTMIGDEVQTMAFTGVAEENSVVTDASKTLTVRSFDQQA